MFRLKFILIIFWHHAVLLGQQVEDSITLSSRYFGINDGKVEDFDIENQWVNISSPHVFSDSVAIEIIHHRGTRPFSRSISKHPHLPDSVNLQLSKSRIKKGNGIIIHFYCEEEKITKVLMIGSIIDLQSKLKD